jgi:hypothetical protein
MENSNNSEELKDIKTSVEWLTDLDIATRNVNRRLFLSHGDGKDKGGFIFGYDTDTGHPIDIRRENFQTRALYETAYRAEASKRLEHSWDSLSRQKQEKILAENGFGTYRDTDPEYAISENKTPEEMQADHAYN